MPPRARKPAPAPEELPAEDTADPGPEPAAAPGPGPTEEQPCTECFPHGWPDEVTSVGCSAHGGSWNR